MQGKRGNGQQGYPLDKGSRIGVRPLAGRGGRRFLPTAAAVSYSPLRSSTHKHSTYTARPLPWWNTMRLNPKTSKGGTMSDTELETTESEEPDTPVEVDPNQTEIEQPDQTDNDDA